MEIKVNKDAMPRRIDAIAKEVVALAVESAEKGQVVFYYSRKKEHIGCNRHLVNNAVEKLSDGSVKCAYRGLEETRTAFKIIEK